MKEITIKQVKQPVGFGKPTQTTLAGAVFDNGKVAYLDSSEEICVAIDEKSLVKDLKADTGCVEVHIIHKA